jgi:hypothetical protein
MTIFRSDAMTQRFRFFVQNVSQTISVISYPFPTTTVGAVVIISYYSRFPRKFSVDLISRDARTLLQNVLQLQRQADKEELVIRNKNKNVHSLSEKVNDDII